MDSLTEFIWDFSGILDLLKVKFTNELCFL